MQNSDYVFGDLIKEPGDYDLRNAPHLTINPISPEKFKQVMYDREIHPDQAKQIWKYLVDATNESYDAHLLSQKDLEPLTREGLESMQLDSSGWLKHAQEIGLDASVAQDLFEDYTSTITESMEAQLDEQEQRQEEAEQAQEAKEEAMLEAGGELSDDVLDTVIKDIRNSPEYFSDKAEDTQAHNRAVSALNAAMSMRANLIPRTWAALEEHTQEMRADEEQAMKDSYGRSSLGSNDFKASNQVPADQSFHGGPDTGKDSLAKSEDSE